MNARTEPKGFWQTIGNNFTQSALGIAALYILYVVSFGSKAHVGFVGDQLPAMSILPLWVAAVYLKCPVHFLTISFPEWHRTILRLSRWQESARVRGLQAARLASVWLVTQFTATYFTTGEANWRVLVLAAFCPALFGLVWFNNPTDSQLRHEADKKRRRRSRARNAALRVVQFASIIFIISSVIFLIGDLLTIPAFELLK